MNEAIYGTCTEMCPNEEIKLRETQGMLHILEMVPGTESLPKPKADKSRIVKMYSRSAAGSNMPSPKNLRTGETLLKTVNYLLNDVVCLKVLPWYIIYDFVADRLLAVRQDILIQRLSKSYYISILQPIIRFYTYSAYRLCEQPIEQFDPVLNNKQLQECLKRLLVLYDECDTFSQKCTNSKVNINLKEFECIYLESRPFFEALYIIFNLSDTHAIFRGLSLKSIWRTELVLKSLRVSMAVLNGNWYRACSLIKELPSLLATAASLHLPVIRRNALKVMSSAYNSKNLKFPVATLKAHLLYSCETDVINDCNYYNIKVEDNVIKFLKENQIFKKDLVHVRHEKFVYEKLAGRDVVELILYGDI